MNVCQMLPLRYWPTAHTSLAATVATALIMVVDAGTTLGLLTTVQLGSQPRVEAAGSACSGACAATVSRGDWRARPPPTTSRPTTVIANSIIRVRMGNLRSSTRLGGLF